MAGKPIMMICDKGFGNGKSESVCFVKLLAEFGKEQENVRVTSIGIEGTGNTTQSEVNRIDYSLTLFDSPNERIQLHGQSTNTGGGTTRDDLKVAARFETSV